MECPGTCDIMAGSELGPALCRGGVMPGVCDIMAGSEPGPALHVGRAGISVCDWEKVGKSRGALG